MTLRRTIFQEQALVVGHRDDVGLSAPLGPAFHVSTGNRDEKNAPLDWDPNAVAPPTPQPYIPEFGIL